MTTQIRGSDGQPVDVLSHANKYNDTAAAAAGLPNNSFALSVQTTLRSSRFSLVTISKSNLDIGSNYSVDPLQPALAQLQSTSVENCRAANTAYWKQYWGRASISLPAQPIIERFWFVSNYMLSSASRPAPRRFGGSTFPNLWGP